MLPHPPPQDETAPQEEAHPQDEQPPQREQPPKQPRPPRNVPPPIKRPVEGAAAYEGAAYAGAYEEAEPHPPPTATTVLTVCQLPDSRHSVRYLVTV